MEVNELRKHVPTILHEGYFLPIFTVSGQLLPFCEFCQNSYCAKCLLQPYKQSEANKSKKKWIKHLQMTEFLNEVVRSLETWLMEHSERNALEVCDNYNEQKDETVVFNGLNVLKTQKISDKSDSLIDSVSAVNISVCHAEILNWCWNSLDEDVVLDNRSESVANLDEYDVCVHEKLTAQKPDVLDKHSDTKYNACDQENANSEFEQDKDVLQLQGRVCKSYDVYTSQTCQRVFECYEDSHRPIDKETTLQDSLIEEQIELPRHEEVDVAHCDSGDVSIECDVSWPHFYNMIGHSKYPEASDESDAINQKEYRTSTPLAEKSFNGSFNGLNEDGDKGRENEFNSTLPVKQNDCGVFNKLKYFTMQMQSPSGLLYASTDSDSTLCGVSLSESKSEETQDSQLTETASVESCNLDMVQEEDVDYGNDISESTDIVHERVQSVALGSRTKQGQNRIALPTNGDIVSVDDTESPGIKNNVDGIEAGNNCTKNECVDEQSDSVIVEKLSNNEDIFPEPESHLADTKVTDEVPVYLHSTKIIHENVLVMCEKEQARKLHDDAALVKQTNISECLVNKTETLSAEKIQTETTIPSPEDQNTNPREKPGVPGENNTISEEELPGCSAKLNRNPISNRQDIDSDILCWNKEFLNYNKNNNGNINESIYVIDDVLNDSKSNLEVNKLSRSSRNSKTYSSGNVSVVKNKTQKRWASRLKARKHSTEFSKHNISKDKSSHMFEIYKGEHSTAFLITFEKDLIQQNVERSQKTITKRKGPRIHPVKQPREKFKGTKNILKTGEPCGLTCRSDSEILASAVDKLSQSESVCMFAERLCTDILVSVCITINMVNQIGGIHYCVNRMKQADCEGWTEEADKLPLTRTSECDSVLSQEETGLENKTLCQHGD